MTGISIAMASIAGRRRIFMHERRNFWEIGTRPDDIHYFQMLAHEAYASRVSTQYSIGELDFRRGQYAIHTKKALFQCGSIRF